MQAGMHQVFDQKGFYPALKADLKKARARTVIHSPFLAIRMIEELSGPLESLVQRGVRVCVFAQIPHGWKSEGEQHPRLFPFKGAVELLKSYGAHVNLRKAIHEKIVVIDDQILWEGSLNILSHFDSSERMNRWFDRDAVHSAVTKHKLSSCEQCPPTPSAWNLDADAGRQAKLELLGRCLKQHRQERGISQSRLSQQSGVAQNIISQFEVGARNVQLNTVVQLFDALDVELIAAPRYSLPAIQSILQITADG